MREQSKRSDQSASLLEKSFDKKNFHSPLFTNQVSPLPLPFLVCYPLVYV